MGNFINTDLLPLEVSDSPWLYENKIVECSTGGGSQYVSKTWFWWK